MERIGRAKEGAAFVHVLAGLPGKDGRPPSTLHRHLPPALPFHFGAHIVIRMTIIWPHLSAFIRWHPSLPDNPIIPLQLFPDLRKVALPSPCPVRNTSVSKFCCSSLLVLSVYSSLQCCFGSWEGSFGVLPRIESSEETSPPLAMRKPGMAGFRGNSTNSIRYGSNGAFGGCGIGPRGNRPGMIIAGCGGIQARRKRNAIAKSKEHCDCYQLASRIMNTPPQIQSGVRVLAFLPSLIDPDLVHPSPCRVPFRLTRSPG